MFLYKTYKVSKTGLCLRPYLPTSEIVFTLRNVEYFKQKQDNEYRSETVTVLIYHRHEQVVLRAFLCVFRIQAAK
jgi:hypothetical protein